MKDLIESKKAIIDAALQQGNTAKISIADLVPDDLYWDGDFDGYLAELRGMYPDWNIAEAGADISGPKLTFTRK